MPTPSAPLPDDLAGLHDAVVGWFDDHARDLPWRGTSEVLPDPWPVLVSELMLQQTPVVRVLPVFEAWMERWPTPADLAAEPSSEAVRAWGRLGYPRRALRLHAAAVAITAEHGGRVPGDHAALLSLPGVGEYTAAAVASFAFGQRHAVMDTNVRRVLARVVLGQAYPSTSITAAERRLAQALLPAALGRPDHDGPPRRGQAWAGTDRQCRGRLLAVLRDATDPVPKAALDAVWDDAAQRERCLDALLDEGLAQVHADGTFTL